MARVLARQEAVPWIRYVLEGGETLHESASRDREGFHLPGRAPVWVIPEKASSGAGPSELQLKVRWAVRHYSRGGTVFSRLLGDRFLRVGEPRPVFEIRISEGARSRGIPTPRIVAAATYQERLFYRADLVTVFVPHSENLAETLFDTRRKGAGGASERLEALGAAGALLKAMVDAGLQHRDLNAGNILLQWAGAAPSAHVLDLDRARLLPQGRKAGLRPMLRRLSRSIRKWEARSGLRLTDREWQTLERAALG
jgi:3-deoxy-D-manno-octulosonic acid kinase